MPPVAPGLHHPEPAPQPAQSETRTAGYFFVYGAGLRASPRFSGRSRQRRHFASAWPFVAVLLTPKLSRSRYERPRLCNAQASHALRLFERPHVGYFASGSSPRGSAPLSPPACHW